MLFRLIFLTVAVFIGCSLWLASVWTTGIETSDWVEITATITGRSDDPVPIPFGVQDTEDEEILPTTNLAYLIEGARYESVVDGLLDGYEVQVFINPASPTEAVTEKGPKFEKMIQPLIGTGASAVIGLILLLIAFISRKEKA